MEFKIDNTNVYGLERSVKASGNPMRTEIDKTDPTDKDFSRAYTLGAVPSGSGHDNFLKGIIVQMDVTAPLYWWKQAQRYHWLDFVSSESTMHCLLKFDVRKQCVKETDSVILDRISDLIKGYNSIPEDDKVAKYDAWRTLVASLPCGFCLSASMTTNYQQLKTIYFQRKDHRLEEWHTFCDWCRTLPEFREMVLGEKK